MPARNTPTSYGSLTRSFHWLMALMIFAAIPLGVIANDLPYDTPEGLAFKAQLFSIHKTLGVAIFAVALLRILWALSQPRPVPLHPNRRAETLMAETVHWALYLSLVVVPLSGWVHHAALDGFAPILWPFGQDLPFVAKSETVASLAGSTHWLFTKLLIASIALHIAGALKHVFIDRDSTLARMTKGTPAGGARAAHSALPVAVAVAIFGAGGVTAWAISKDIAPAPAAPTTIAATTGGWQVTEGNLSFTARQMGATVTGTLPVWSAEIDFDPATGTGQVSVQIDMAQVTLGSVTDQARGAEFFDTAAHPTASFTAAITPEGDAFTAIGTLTLRGAAQLVTLPFAMTIADDTATMTATLTLDRRDFGIGPSYPDEATVGFAVDVAIALTASRK